NLPPLRCLPQPRLPRHYLPPNRVRHKIGTDHLSRPPRVAICSPPPPAAATGGGEGFRRQARVGTHRTCGRSTQPPGRMPSPPRRTRRREGAPPRTAAWAAPTGRAAPLAWVAPTARAAPIARAAPPRRRPPDRRARPPPASAPPDRTSVAGRERRGGDGADVA